MITSTKRIHEKTGQIFVQGGREKATAWHWVSYKMRRYHAFDEKTVFFLSLQSAVRILYLVCILYPVCSLQSAFVLTITDNKRSVDTLTMVDIAEIIMLSIPVTFHGDQILLKLFKWRDKYLALFLVCVYTLRNNYSTVHSGLTYSLQTRFASTRITSTATTGRDWGFVIYSRLFLEQWQWGVRKPVPFVEVILLSYVFMIVQYWKCSFPAEFSVLCHLLITKTVDIWNTGLNFIRIW